MGNHSQLVHCLLAAGMGPVTGALHPIVLFTDTSVLQSNRFALQGRASGNRPSGSFPDTQEGDPERAVSGFWDMTLGKAEARTRDPVGDVQMPGKRQEE